MDTLLTMLEQDFVELYRTCASIHVSSVLIKLLDMHISDLFPDPTSPTYMSDLSAMASRMEGGVSVPLLRETIENNSFQGLKGSGLAINFPFVTELMSRAIIRAAYTADQEGVVISPVIMIPGVISELEVQMIAPLVHTVAANLHMQMLTMGAQKHNDINYFIGCVLETPRSLLRAEFIANLLDIKVIAFDTDKITEHMLGVARTDSRQHLFKSNVFAKNQDPFQTLDFTGVGSLLSKAVNQITNISKTNRPQLMVTGRHVSDAKSCKFFEAIGVNYLSCEPSLVSIAKIEAAKAHIEEVIRHDKLLSSRVWGLLNQARIL
jgi:pyruvate,orthophosphate dikinase